jgi:type I restriction enzyme S subunit
MTALQRIVVGDLMKAGEANLQTGPFGTQLKASDYVEEGVPVINVRNIGNGRLRAEKLEFLNERMAAKLDAHRLQRGDIVFGRKGAVDRHLLVDESTQGWIQGSDCLRLRINSERVYPPFVSFYFDTNGHKEWMNALCSFGATMPSLNQDIVSRITLPFPAYHTQKKIAAILSAYDELIETNQRRIALLEKLAEEIYREWFVRLRFPGHEKVKKIKGVPEGWSIRSIDESIAVDEASLQTGPFGTYLKASDYTESGTPVINVRNIGMGNLKPDKLEYLPETMVHKLAQHVLKSGDIVFARKGAVERHLLITEAQDGWIQGSDCIRIRLNPTSVSPSFLSMGFRQASHQEWMLNNCSSGATMPSLNERILKRLAFLVPPLELAAEFSGIIDPIFSQSNTLEMQNTHLTRTRDLLLPRLISGKLSVEDLDIQFPPGMAEESTKRL